MALSAGARLSDAVGILTEGSAGGSDDALAAVATALDAIVPADGGGWVGLDLAVRGAAVRSFHDEREDDHAIAAGILETADDHPMVRAIVLPSRGVRGRVYRMSDLVSRAGLHRTRAYAHMLGPLGIEHQAFVATSRTVGRAARGWAFNRGRADITDRELERLGQVQPLLAVIDRLGAHPPVTGPVATDRWGLTAREAQVLSYLADGWTADAIGALCGISGRTVRKHLEHAYEKLDCHDKVTAVLRFRESAYRP